MASTGLLFVLFVLMHMYGNLKAFGGQSAFDTYAEHLRTIGEPILPYAGFLWVFNIVLVLAAIAHVWSALWLWNRAHGARPAKYEVKKLVAASVSSRMMRWGGVFIFLFLIFHLLMFTTQTIQINGAYASEYQMMVAAFGSWWVDVIYLAALFALGMHLHHGVWSAAQTLGWTNSPRARRNAKLTGLAVALVISVGFALTPLGVMAGIITK